MPRNWLILTALTIEAKAIAQSFGVAPAPPGQLTELPSAKLAVIGIRGSRLKGVPTQGVDTVILAGFAGALDPALKIGDVVKARGDLSSRIYTADVVISTPAEKAELFRRAGAPAVDMESSIVQTWAQSAGLSLVAIRVISDTAQDTLPTELAECIDDVGNVRSAALARKLAFGPSLMPKLVRLQKNSRIALDALAKAVKEELNSTC